MIAHAEPADEARQDQRRRTLWTLLPDHEQIDQRRGQQVVEWKRFDHERPAPEERVEGKKEARGGRSDPARRQSPRGRVDQPHREHAADDRKHVDSEGDRPYREQAEEVAENR